jgi:hypothetical protein
MFRDYISKSSACLEITSLWNTKYYVLEDIKKNFIVWAQQTSLIQPHFIEVPVPWFERWCICVLGVVERWCICVLGVVERWCICVLGVVERWCICVLGVVERWCICVLGVVERWCMCVLGVGERWCMCARCSWEVMYMCTRCRWEVMYMCARCIHTFSIGFWNFSGATRGAGTVYPSGAPGFTPSFNGVFYFSV